jgi:hypothetical protein
VFIDVWVFRVPFVRTKRVEASEDLSAAQRCRTHRSRVVRQSFLKGIHGFPSQR